MPVSSLRPTGQKQENLGRGRITGKEGTVIPKAPRAERRKQEAPRWAWPPLSPTHCPHPQSVQGTGLAFIAFTEAMTHFPASPFWSVMFFLMLINLGLGSMIGTMAGITTPIIDTFKVPKEMFTGNSSQRSPLALWAAPGGRGKRSGGSFDFRKIGFLLGYS